MTDFVRFLGIVILSFIIATALVGWPFGKKSCIPTSTPELAQRILDHLDVESAPKNQKQRLSLVEDLLKRGCCER